jgi:hypothetical protein
MSRADKQMSSLLCIAIAFLILLSVIHVERQIERAACIDKHGVWLNKVHACLKPIYWDVK